MLSTQLHLLGGHGQGQVGQAEGGDGWSRWNLDRPPRPSAHRQGGTKSRFNPLTHSLHGRCEGAV